MLIMIKSSRITYLSICFGAKYINLWYYKDKSTTLQIYPLRGKTTAKTDKFEKNTVDNYVCCWTNTG